MWTGAAADGASLQFEPVLAAGDLYVAGQSYTITVAYSKSRATPFHCGQRLPALAMEWMGKDEGGGEGPVHPVWWWWWWSPS